MLVQIFASSACTGVVCTIGAPSGSNSSRRALARGLADAADDARQRADLGHEAVGGDALRHVGDEDVLADAEAALLLQVAGDELGRARARRSSAARAGWPSRRSGSRSSSTARMSRMSISMCESAGVPSVSTIASACAASAACAGEVRAWTRASSSSVPGSLNGIRPLADRGQALLVVVDAEHAQPGVGEAERERQADPAEPDDGDVVAHRGRQASDARRRSLRARTGARTRSRSAGCSAGSASTAGAAPAASRNSHSSPQPLHQAAAPAARARRGSRTPRRRRSAPGASSRVAHPRHPLLLLGHADPDPHDVGAAAVDVARDGVLLGVASASRNGRRVAADDLQARVAQAQRAGELGERALVAAAVEVHPLAGLARRARTRWSISSGP